MGVIGVEPSVYWYSCYKDIASISSGYDVKKRDEWQRHLLVVQALTGEAISYDDLFSGGTGGSTEIKSKDDWLAHLAKFKSPDK